MAAKTEDKLIDIAKLFFAFAVVAIHTSLLDYLGQNVSVGGQTVLFAAGRLILSLAVPFFFVCSGYYFKPNGRFIPKQVKRLLVPYFFWSLLYTAVISVSNRSIDFKGIIKGYLLASPGAAMWFVGAIIISFVILNRVRSKKAAIAVCVVSLVFYFIGLGLNSYSSLFVGTPAQALLQKYYFDIFESSRNFLFLGLPFISIGYYFGQCANEKKRSKSVLLTLFVLACIGTVAEFLFLYSKPEPMENGVRYCFSTPLAVVTLMLILAGIEIKSDRNFRYVRKLSSGIYFSHLTILVVLTTVNGLLYHFGLKGSSFPNSALFLLTSVCSLIFTSIVIKINNKYLNKII